MKIVIYKGFGGYYVPNDVMHEIGCDEFDETTAIRTNPTFINWVEDVKKGKDLIHVFKIVEIPDNATDFIINSDEDGCEEIFAVVDGKIVNIY